MNFADARPLGLPRVLAPPPEEAQKAKTPTPEPFDSETRKVSTRPATLVEPHQPHPDPVQPRSPILLRPSSQSVCGS